MALGLTWSMAPAHATDDVTVVGHRGVTWAKDSKTRENSLFALRRLVRGEWMETDVRLIADRNGVPGAGRAVLAHDPTTTRVTTAASRAGKPDAWSDLSFAQFRELRLNGGGSPSTARRMFTVAARRGVTMLVEVKDTNGRKALPAMARAADASGARVIWYSELNKNGECDSRTLETLRVDLDQEVGVKWTPGCDLSLEETGALGAVVNARYGVTSAEVREARTLGMTLVSRGPVPWTEVQAGGSHVLVNNPVQLRRRLAGR